jgi:uncharacterized delta-60 repeat protein
VIFARLKHRASFALVGALAVLVASASPAAAAPGDLDTTFDGDGKVTTDFAGSQDGAGGVAIQGDGKIVAAGSAAVSASNRSLTLDFALARYNTDGSLDTTFDGDGLVITDFAGDLDAASDVAIQGDGKIVALGRAYVSSTFDADFALARYNTDGSLDATFGTGGKVNTDFGGDFDLAFGVAIQGDGKIVAAGETDSGTEGFALARYTTDGSLDTTFDGDGKVTTGFGGFDEAFGVAIQGDGKIVAAGATFDFDPCCTYDFALARYNTDGSLDATFGTGGKVTTDFGSDVEYASDVAIQGDGKIVAAGFTSSSANDDFALGRYNTDGSLDATFDGDGKVTTDFAGESDIAEGVAIQGDGKIVAAGCVNCFTGSVDFALARYNTDGSLDATFGTGGKVTTDFAGDSDFANAVAIQGDGKIVAAGGTHVSLNDNDFALARYTCVRRTSRPTSIPHCP